MTKWGENLHTYISRLSNAKMMKGLNCKMVNWLKGKILKRFKDLGIQWFDNWVIRLLDNNQIIKWLNF